MKYLIATIVIIINNCFAAIYKISPSLKISLIRLSKNTLKKDIKNNSLTENYIKKEIKKDNYNGWENYIKNCVNKGYFIYDQKVYEDFSNLILKSIETEKKLSKDNYIFYHGTLATKLILINTVLNNSKNNFLLRTPEDILQAKCFDTAHNYFAKKSISQYLTQGNLSRFDNQQEIKKLLLPVNSMLLANFHDHKNEDSLSFLYGNSRCKPNDLEYNIKKCLDEYKIKKIPRDIDYWLSSPLGSLITVIIPKEYRNIAYLSQPFGIPIELPHFQLLTGDIPIDQAKKLLAEDTYKSKLNDKNLKNYPQARILLHPNYFLKEESHIKVEMILWQDEKDTIELQEKLKFFLV